MSLACISRNNCIFGISGKFIGPVGEELVTATSCLVIWLAQAIEHSFDTQRSTTTCLKGKGMPSKVERWPSNEIECSIASHITTNIPFACYQLYGRNLQTKSSLYVSLSGPRWSPDSWSKGMLVRSSSLTAPRQKVNNFSKPKIFP